MLRGILVAALTAACAAGGTTTATGSVSCPPQLTIVQPRPGATVEAPFPVRYRIRCFRVGRGYGHIHAWLDPERRSVRIELRPTRLEGTLQFPDGPMNSGRRTVLFELARADHSRVRAPTARVIVPLVIEGSRTP